MNHYGAQARRHWQEYLPQRYATLDDPSSYFSTLGEQAATQIEQRSRELAGPDQPGEGYLDKLGRLNNAKMRAEEEILPELILITPETDDPDPAGDPPSATATTPAPDEWVPLTEDPTHPYWQQVAEEEADLAEDPPNR
jgi:hypothetical protein